MSTYTIKTPSLKTTVLDARKLTSYTVQADSIKVGDKNVATEDKLITSIKHTGDNREVITENDLWGSWAEIKDGEVIFHDDEVVNPSKDTQDAWNRKITKVENNKAYVGDNLYANIQTEKIKDGDSMFQNCSYLTSFTSDLSSLDNGNYMFGRSSIISFESDLSSLKTGDYMFTNCSGLTSFISDLSALQTGRYMFASCGLTNFNTDLSSLTNGFCMFAECGFSTFTSDLSSLTKGTMMFDSCENLTTFTSDLPSLTIGSMMFELCPNLTTFTSDLSSLKTGDYMFYGCMGLTSFRSDLPSLQNGEFMFYECYNLESFTSDLSSLVNGCEMFSYCPILTSFTSDLSSLVNGSGMFYDSTLDNDSLLHIAESIRDVSNLVDGETYLGYEINKVIHLGLGRTPTEDDVEYLTEIYNKGWAVFVIENPEEDSERFEPTANMLLDDQEETIAPTPYWAKPKEVNEKSAKYIGEDGKYYIILGGNHIFVDDPETYGLFTSLEDAAANMRLTKIEKKSNKN